MTNKERNIVKKQILKCLTEDFKGNQALFIKDGPFKGEIAFNGTDLTMVMDAVVKGLDFAKHEIVKIKIENDKKNEIGNSKAGNIKGK